jgi:hypothetical protein
VWVGTLKFQLRKHFQCVVVDYQSYEAAYVHRRQPPPPYAYDTQANPNYGFGPLVPVDPNDVISGNRIIGRDPDPFIRGEILRHYDSGWPD